MKWSRAGRHQRNNSGKGDSLGCSQRALPGKPPAAPSPGREETRSLHYQQRIDSNMNWQTSAACPAACIERFRQDPYIVKLYGIAVPPKLLCARLLFCFLFSLSHAHTRTQRRTAAPDSLSGAFPAVRKVPAARAGLFPIPGWDGDGAPAASRSLSPAAPPRSLTLMLGLLPPPPPRRISSECLFLG